MINTNNRHLKVIRLIIKNGFRKHASFELKLKSMKKIVVVAFVFYSSINFAQSIDSSVNPIKDSTAIYLQNIDYELSKDGSKLVLKTVNPAATVKKRDSIYSLISIKLLENKFVVTELSKADAEKNAKKSDLEQMPNTHIKTPRGM